MSATTLVTSLGAARLGRTTGPPRVVRPGLLPPAVSIVRLLAGIEHRCSRRR
ncbi:hypothetical protein [Streptomyces sp. RB17]|uniref:hypothetical protein n=1 Tax=Streptomyces sp. RB17 TaxID=2585197 RepID=UPI00129689D5|nr:hypothetical protein [Streptomyces sp. RB17]